MSLELRRATRTYRRGREAPVVGLDAVDLAVGEGELVVLVGPSGSGKSTLLRAVAGLEVLDSGSVHLAGRDVTHAPPAARSVAMVFQDLALFPHLTVAQNVGFGARARGGAAREVGDKVVAAARTLGIEAVLPRRPGELSGGERQRVALARALLREPAVFLLDEPLSAVDTELRVRLREEIKDLQRRTGVAMVHVTHDSSEAMSLADRVAVMRTGRVEQVGSTVEIWQRPATIFVARLLATVPLNVVPASCVGEVGEHVLAVRAEDVQLRAPGDGGLAAAVVDVVLDAGTAVVRLAGPSGPLHARVPWAARPAPGDEVAVAWEQSAVHRFAADTGRRLA